MSMTPFNLEFDGLDQYGAPDFRKAIVVVTKLKGRQEIKIMLEEWDAVWFGRQDGPIRKDRTVRFILECPEIGGNGVVIKHKERGYLEGWWEYFSPDYYREIWETLLSPND